MVWVVSRWSQTQVCQWEPDRKETCAASDQHATASWEQAVPKGTSYTAKMHKIKTSQTNACWIGEFGACSGTTDQHKVNTGGPQHTPQHQAGEAQVTALSPHTSTPRHSLETADQRHRKFIMPYTSKQKRMLNRTDYSWITSYFWLSQGNKN